MVISCFVSVVLFHVGPVCYFPKLLPKPCSCGLYLSTYFVQDLKTLKRDGQLARFYSYSLLLEIGVKSHLNTWIKSGKCVNVQRKSWLLIQEVG